MVGLQAAGASRLIEIGAALRDRESRGNVSDFHAHMEAARSARRSDSPKRDEPRADEDDGAEETTSKPQAPAVDSASDANAAPVDGAAVQVPVQIPAEPIQPTPGASTTDNHTDEAGIAIVFQVGADGNASAVASSPADGAQVDQAPIEPRNDTAPGTPNRNVEQGSAVTELVDVNDPETAPPTQGTQQIQPIPKSNTPAPAAASGNIDSSHEETPPQDHAQDDDAPAPRTASSEETARDQRVRASVEQALNRPTLSGSRRSADDVHAAPANREAQPAAVARDAAGLKDASDLVSVRGGSGDAVAASIARFLVEGSASMDRKAATSDASTRGAGHATAGESNGMTGTMTPAPASAGAAGAADRAHVGGATATFSDILASRVDRGAALDTTARVLGASNSPGRWQVTLQLDPPELGPLRLDVRVQQSAMTLRVDAETAGVGRLVASRMGELRDALAAHGIQIERSEVVVRSEPSGSSNPDSHRPDDRGAQHFNGGSDTRGSGWGFAGGSGEQGAGWDGSDGWSGGGERESVEPVEPSVYQDAASAVDVMA